MRTISNILALAGLALVVWALTRLSPQDLAPAAIPGLGGLALLGCSMALLAPGESARRTGRVLLSALAHVLCGLLLSGLLLLLGLRPLEGAGAPVELLAGAVVLGGLLFACRSVLSDPPSEPGRPRIPSGDPFEDADLDFDLD